MGIMEIIGAILTILVTVLPTLLADYAATKKENNDLRRRSIDELDAGAQRVRDQSAL